MLNVLGWLDFGAAEQRKAIHLLDQLRDRDTVDELGLGSIRDAFADRLFPGMSTVQTRARYFLIVPWIYRTLESKQIPSADFARRVRAEEVAVIKSLADLGPRQGVIGIDAQEKLKRFPSSIYWYGLERLGIRRFHGSQRDYIASLDRYYGRVVIARGARNDDWAHTETAPNWDPGLPPRPTAIDTLDLTPAEAAYLLERIQINAGDSLLAEFSARRTTTIDINSPWEHPAARALPPLLATDLVHARHFSDISWLATLHYQRVLAEAVASEAGTDGEDAERKRDTAAADFEASIEELRARGEGFVQWDRRNFWFRLASISDERIGGRTRQFVDAWLELVTPVIVHGSPFDHKAATQLISAREQSLKGPLARVTNAEARRAWISQAIPRPMDYRWTATVHKMLLDIQEGLAR